MRPETRSAGHLKVLFIFVGIFAVPKRKSKDSVLRIRCRSSAAYTLGEKELNESTDLLCHFICSGDTAPNPSKQMWCTHIKVEKDWIWRCKVRKQINQIYSNYPKGLWHCRYFVCFALDNKPTAMGPWVHSEQIQWVDWNLSQNTTRYIDTTCFSNMAQCFNGQLGVSVTVYPWYFMMFSWDSWGLSRITTHKYPL